MTKIELQSKALQEQHALLALMTLQADCLRFDLSAIQIMAALQGYIDGKQEVIASLKKDIKSL